LSIFAIGILPITNSEIVWRRRDHQIDAFICQSRHSLDAIFDAKIKFGHRRELLPGSARRTSAKKTACELVPFRRSHLYANSFILYQCRTSPQN
jgi:hypothetical protein